MSPAARHSRLQFPSSFFPRTPILFAFLILLLAISFHLAGMMSYVYDANNNVTSLTDAESKQTQYTYDPRNLKTLETYPDDNVILGTGINDHIGYTYDAANRVTTRMDQLNQTIGYTWDMASRLTSRTYPDTTNDTFTFDNASRLLTATSARYSNVVTRTYDAAGRMTADNLTVGTTTYDVAFGYDNADRNTGITYPDSSSVARAYTDRNQLYTVSYTPNGGSASTIATRTYDDGMRLTSTALGNSLTETRTYTTGDNTTASISVPSVTSFTYTYDANKNKTAEADGILTNYAWSTGTTGYDDKDRLINWSRTGGDTQTWSLTKVGDWANTVIDGTTDTRTHNDVHELTARTTPSATLTYDLKGNQTTNSNSQTYTWDFDNKLATAIVGTTTWTYAYDALRRRVSKSDGTTTTLFVSAANQEIAEYVGGTMTKKCVFGDYIDEPLTMINVSGGTETTYYYHANSQYSIAAMTDSTGTVQERYVYTPYGKQTILDPAGTTVRSSSTIGNAILYTGRRLDPETGLYYYRARYYDADQGRFISRDSMGYFDGMVLYEYVKSDPLDFLDYAGTDANGNPDPNASSGGAEHLGGGESTRGQHEAGQARKQMDRGGEKGDEIRRSNGQYPRRRPNGWKGPWPPKKNNGSVHTPLLKTIALCGCEIVCASRYNACVQKADQELEDDLKMIDQKANSGQYDRKPSSLEPAQFDQQAMDDDIDNVTNIHTLAVAECATNYTICGLSCLLPWNWSP